MRLLAAFLLLAPFAVAGDDLAARTLKVWDTNRDGALTKDEFPDEATFLKADRDKDGKVTEEEIAIFLGLKKAPPPAETKKAPKAKPVVKKPAKARGESVSDGGMQKRPFTIPERVKDFFKRFDRDKDKKVTRKEAAGIGEDMWKRFDRNRDDAFTYREATRYMKYTIAAAKKRPNRANFFELFDKNRDKKVTRAEYDGPS